MTKKQFLRSVAFFLVLSVMLLALCDLFEEANTENSDKRFYKYRTLEKGTVDAVLLGTSGMDRYWIASQGYEDYGMTVYPLASNSMPVWLYIELIEEALAYQNPELIILDIRPFSQVHTNANTMDVRARRLLDVMNPLSLNRLSAAFKTMEAIHTVDSSASRFDLSYIFSFIKYHSKWEDDDYSIKDNLWHNEHNYLGFYVGNKASILKTKLSPSEYDSSYFEQLDPLSEKYLYEVIDYIKENELNVLFLETPQVRSRDAMGRSNTVYSILEKEGMNYLHYYIDGDSDGTSLDLDFTSDFYNSGHVNFYGATKFTKVFSKYLDENYNLPDRRNDQSVKEDWDGVHDKLVDKIALLEFEKKNK